MTPTVVVIAASLASGFVLGAMFGAIIATMAAVRGGGPA